MQKAKSINLQGEKVSQVFTKAKKYDNINDSRILAKANVICADSTIACEKNGELHHALDSGLIEINAVQKLGTFISSKQKRKPSDITVCDLVGIGFQDAVIASCVMDESCNINKKEETLETK